MFQLGLSSILALLMFLTAAGAAVLTPKHAFGPDIKIDALSDQVPKAFGDWRIQENGGVNIVSPDVAEKLNELYSDTLSRTYINPRGDRIMLSLAYGRLQNRDMQVHKPEVCYVAQGFQIGPLIKVDIAGPNQSIPVMRLTAQLGKRVEPITYWIRSGDALVRGWFEQNKIRITSGFKGVINDGFLVRVSSISADEKSAYLTQEMFIKDLLTSIKPEHRQMFLGKNIKDQNY
jgi:EpsI family protein